MKEGDRIRFFGFDNENRRHVYEGTVLGVDKNGLLVVNTVSGEILINRKLVIGNRGGESSSLQGRLV